MVNLIKILFIYLMFGLVFNSVVYADDSFFDDEVVFEDSTQELDEWSDDSDIFGDESIDDEKSLAWLNLGVSQKWGLILLVAIAPQKKELN